MLHSFLFLNQLGWDEYHYGNRWYHGTWKHPRETLQAEALQTWDGASLCPPRHSEGPPWRCLPYLLSRKVLPLRGCCGPNESKSAALLLLKLLFFLFLVNNILIHPGDHFHLGLQAEFHFPQALPSTQALAQRRHTPGGTDPHDRREGKGIPFWGRSQDPQCQSPLRLLLGQDRLLKLWYFWVWL